MLKTILSVGPGKRSKLHFGAAFLLVSFGLAGLAFAADPSDPVKRDSKYYVNPPSSEEIGNHLFPDAVVRSRSRGISFANSEPEPTAQKSVSFPILFHFGKTTILQQSLQFLDNVGAMMISEPYSERTLIVEGHTDAVGSEAFNKKLSERRALAVKEYLVKQFGIDPMRLFPTGKGESLLYEPNKPHDGINRRVEFLPFQDNG